MRGSAMFSSIIILCSLLSLTVGKSVGDNYRRSPPAPWALKQNSQNVVGASDVVRPVIRPGQATFHRQPPPVPYYQPNNNQPNMVNPFQPAGQQFPQPNQQPFFPSNNNDNFNNNNGFNTNNNPFNNNNNGFNNNNNNNNPFNNNNNFNQNQGLAPFDGQQMGVEYERVWNQMTQVWDQMTQRLQNSGIESDFSNFFQKLSSTVEPYLQQLSQQLSEMMGIAVRQQQQQALQQAGTVENIQKTIGDLFQNGDAQQRIANAVNQILGNSQDNNNFNNNNNNNFNQNNDGFDMQPNFPGRK